MSEQLQDPTFEIAVRFVTCKLAADYWYEQAYRYDGSTRDSIMTRRGQFYDELAYAAIELLPTVEHRDAARREYLSAITLGGNHRLYLEVCQ